MAGPVPVPRSIGFPPGGWRPGYYVVEVAHTPGNPIHRAIFHFRAMYNDPKRGPVPDGIVWRGGYEEPTGTARLYYLYPISRIDFGEPTTTKTPSELAKERG